MVRQHEGVILRKVDLSKRDTPVVEQATSEFGVRGIPSVHVYGKDGRPVAQDLHGFKEIEAAVIQALR